jgi:selenobiotic family peptide radical SAM maturase
MTNTAPAVSNIFPACHSLVDPQTWPELLRGLPQEADLDRFPGVVASLAQALDLPAYLPELAQLEYAVHECGIGSSGIPGQVAKKTLNPSLRVLDLNWSGLTRALGKDSQKAVKIVPEREAVLAWFDPHTNKTRAQPADDRLLVGLKIVSEELAIGMAALEYGVPVAQLHRAVDQAVQKGLVLAPKSLLRRHPERFCAKEKHSERFLVSRVFTLQWHVTQACDLHCRHCYDRTERTPLSLDRAMLVLDELEAFCLERNVRAKVTFTGGNPLLYPDFDALYLEAVKRGFPVSILGNPVSRERLERLLRIQCPTLYQVSLEGLREHNDHIRQPGYYDRVMAFLPLLQELGIPSQVMLTLTRDNMDQVLPLAEELRDMTDLFTFNRLSAVGQGASLRMPDPQAYQAFLREYLESCPGNPVLGLKDNLINLIRDENEQKPFGGCTGFGCGAAFNFLTLLSDGEVHACRKFPSPLGNIFEHGLSGCYDSEAGQVYRSGSKGCKGCKLLPACGGCQAVVSSLGLDPAKDRDPYCFRDFSNDSTIEDTSLR